jgi:hypothetical protein
MNWALTFVRVTSGGGDRTALLEFKPGRPGKFGAAQYAIIVILMKIRIQFVERRAV